MGHDGFKRILGTKIHVAIEQNGLPISIVIGSANEHDSTRFIEVIENISTYLDEDVIEQIVLFYADRGYDARFIREYLKTRNIEDCIPYRINSKTILQNNTQKITTIQEILFLLIHNQKLFVISILYQVLFF
ncbi:MAG: transposase [Thaumarchaeota archaeon]|nr:transposase [Nitrososphaerota archaeon]